MLMMFVLLGCGFLAAGVYTALADSSDRNAKLKRIQKELARREAIEKETENKE